MGTTTYWLIVETPQNWEVDRSNDFKTFAVSSRYKRAAHEMKVGDLIITYVSKASAFSDVRIVRSSSPRPISGIRQYDRPFDWEIDTELLLDLNTERWLRVGLMIDDLILTKGKRNWGPIFLTSVRRLEEPDGKRLVAEMKRVAFEGGTDDGRGEFS